MADVFISYKRDERAAIERIATRLRALGLSVWFDASMSAGENFNDEIDREARAARCILVCWSPAARESRWVKAEAMIGFEQEKLIACYVSGPDTFSPPTPFNTSHTEDLRTWLSAPSDEHAAWKSVLRRAGKLCARRDVEAWARMSETPSAQELRRWITEHRASPIVPIANAVLVMREKETAERARLEREARETGVREEAEQRARHPTSSRSEWPRVDGGRAEGQPIKNAYPMMVGALAVIIVMALVTMMSNSAQLRSQTIEAPPARVNQPSDAVHEITTATDRLRAGEEFDDCNGAGWCPTMVVIPAGAFTMGSQNNERESPRHRVEIRQFAASKFEITYDEWSACVNHGGCSSNANPPDAGWGQADRPVVNIYWGDAQEYVQWLSRETRQSYRLLTEAEWEYAARAGTSTPYTSGSSILASQARFNNSATVPANGVFSAGNVVGATAPVGSYPPNAFGLHDMHGNVWEWVEDCWHDNYRAAPIDGSAWRTDGDCSRRVLRGGSWIDPAEYLTSYNRRAFETAGSNIGFRIARTL